MLIVLPYSPSTRSTCPASTVHLGHLLGTCKCSTSGCLPSPCSGASSPLHILPVLTLIHPPILVYPTLLLETFLDRSRLCVVHSHQPSLPIPPYVTLCIITKKQLSNENICHGPFLNASHLAQGLQSVKTLSNI